MYLSGPDIYIYIYISISISISISIYILAAVKGRGGPVFGSDLKEVPACSSLSCFMASVDALLDHWQLITSKGSCELICA